MCPSGGGTGATLRRPGERELNDERTDLTGCAAFRVVDALGVVRGLGWSSAHVEPRRRRTEKEARGGSPPRRACRHEEAVAAARRPAGGAPPRRPARAVARPAPARGPARAE